LSHAFYTVGFEESRQKSGLSAQKEWAGHVLKKYQGTEDLHEKIRTWLIEEGKNVLEVGKLDQEEEVEDKGESEDEASRLDTTEEYDWTSTSTLE
jgi:hypothetical protein